MCEVHQRSRGYYGSPRVTGQLRLDGHQVGRRRVARLTAQALRQSARNRNPGAGLTSHGDRGVEYAAYEFRRQFARLGMLQSMNRAGKMNDNAHMESFFHSMKCEELYGKTFDNEEQLRQVLSSYIAFYKHRRLHSSLDYLPPAVFERRQAL